MRAIGFLVMVLLAAGPAAADVYRWVDGQGRTHYSDQPPPNGDREVEKTRIGPVLSGAAAKNVQRTWEQVQRLIATLAEDSPAAWERARSESRELVTVLAASPERQLQSLRQPAEDLLRRLEASPPAERTALLQSARLLQWRLLSYPGATTFGRSEGTQREIERWNQLKQQYLPSVTQQVETETQATGNAGRDNDDDGCTGRGCSSTYYPSYPNAPLYPYQRPPHEHAPISQQPPSDPKPPPVAEPPKPPPAPSPPRTFRPVVPVTPAPPMKQLPPGDSKRRVP